MRDAFQRFHVRTLFQELDLPTLHICDGHLEFFKAAEITPMPALGSHLNDALDALGTEQLRALSRALLDPRVSA